MELDFVIRNALYSRGSTALTLEPVEWMRETDEWEDAEDGSGKFRKQERVPAGTEGDDEHVVDVWEVGGKLTELRFDEVPEAPWMPGGYLTLIVRQLGE